MSKPCFATVAVLVSSALLTQPVNDRADLTVAQAAEDLVGGLDVLQYRDAAAFHRRDGGGAALPERRGRRSRSRAAHSPT